MKFKKNMLYNIFHRYNKRYSSTTKNIEIRTMKNDLFTEEKLRQQSLITRIEKKTGINYIWLPSDAILMVNKNLSTPYNCAMYIDDFLCRRSVFAEVNGKLWDMHRPLTQTCDLRLLNFEDPFLDEDVNDAYWRSCSFLMGMIIEKALESECFVDLLSWPVPDIYSGSYVYDVDLGIANWKITTEKLNVLTTMMQELSSEDNRFERLDVTKSLALKMFAYNRFKWLQISSVPGNTITLYRVKDHVDINCGPMISNTQVVGTTQITAAHQLKNRNCYRFQGVSIPKQLTLSSYEFGEIADRAKAFNRTNNSPEIAPDEEYQY